MYITPLIIWKTYLFIISLTVQFKCNLTEGQLILSMADSSWYTLYTYYYFEVNVRAVSFATQQMQIYMLQPRMNHDI